MAYYIAHSGVKGQKHGVRRYQNKDGTWTPLGKMRRAQMERGGPKKLDGEAKKGAENAPRSASSMTDDELRAQISRMQLEEQYNTYLAKRNPKKESRAKKIAAQLLEKGAMAVGDAAINAVTKNLFKEKKDAERPINLDSLTPEKLKGMTKSQLDKVNAYSDALEKAKKAIDKSGLNEDVLNKRMSDIQNFTKLKASGKAYFDALSGEGATKDELAYYSWLGEHAAFNRQ